MAPLGVFIEHRANSLWTRGALAQLGGSQGIFSVAGTQELLNEEQKALALQTEVAMP